MTIDLRRADDPSSTEVLQLLASRLWPLGLHPGGLGWAHARGRLGDAVIVLLDDGEPVGWATAEGPHDAETLALVPAGRSDLAERAVEWLLSMSDHPALTVEIGIGAEALAGALGRAGFAELPGPGRRALFLDVDDGDRRDEAAGYRVRAVRPGEDVARVEVHRAAWAPDQLPWPEGRAPAVEPGATSSFTAEQYDAVRQVWLYDPDLDLVVEAPDGSLAGCCLVWFDPSSGVAEIEPLGVVPAHRRRGLAGALCHEAARRVRARGGRELFINTDLDPEYPASTGAYLRAGFALRPYSRLFRRAG